MLHDLHPRALPCAHHTVGGPSCSGSGRGASGIGPRAPAPVQVPVVAEPGYYLPTTAQWPESKQLHLKSSAPHRNTWVLLTVTNERTKHDSCPCPSEPRGLMHIVCFEEVHVPYLQVHIRRCHRVVLVELPEGWGVHVHAICRAHFGDLGLGLGLELRLGLGLG